MEFYKTDVSCNYANVVIITPVNSLSTINTTESSVRIIAVSWGTQQSPWTNVPVKKKKQARQSDVTFTAQPGKALQTWCKQDTCHSKLTSTRIWHSSSVVLEDGDTARHTQRRCRFRLRRAAAERSLWRGVSHTPPALVDTCGRSSNSCIVLITPREAAETGQKHWHSLSHVKSHVYFQFS